MNSLQINSPENARQTIPDYDRRKDDLITAGAKLWLGDSGQ